jgi:hypothetical protein
MMNYAYLRFRMLLTPRRKVIHVPIGTTRRMKRRCRDLEQRRQNPPVAPFGKGGGPQDRGIFAAIFMRGGGDSLHFHNKRQVRQ